MLPPSVCTSPVICAILHSDEDPRSIKPKVLIPWNESGFLAFASSVSLEKDATMGMNKPFSGGTATDCIYRFIRHTAKAAAIFRV